MYFYNMIKDMSDEEIEKHISYEIRDLEILSKFNNNNCDFIGYKLSYNPSDIDFMAKEQEDAFPMRVRCFYGGYIPIGTKIVFGCTVDKNGVIANSGMYYIMDTDLYVYEFAKYIKDKNVINEEDFFEYLLAFLDNYFGIINNNSRDEMFKMILKNNRAFHDPIKEHMFSDFKKKGNAMCTEYSVMANNILNVFGFDSYVVIGQEKDEKAGSGEHAFNIVSYVNEDNEKTNLLVDFANGVNVFDYKYNKLGNSPYILPLDRFDNDFLDDFLSSKIHLIDSEYYFVVMGKSLFKLILDKNRDYYVSDKIMVKNMSSGRQK